MEIFTHVTSFFIEAIIIVAAILISIAGIVAIISKNRHKQSGQLIIKSINKHYNNLKNTLEAEILTKKEFKQLLKEEKKLQKKDKKQKNRIFVINFNGDIRASAVKNLREEISAIIHVAQPADQVFVRLESPGGVMYGYGLAASQLQRIKDASLKLTIAVDKVAASGGYMMACVADKIIAAPFAIIGSIGVIAQLPNFHRLLKKNDIDFEQITAGEYKRTLTIFGENTKKDREKMQEEINVSHDLFKQFVSEHRPQLDMHQVATGEHWFALQAKELMLVDQIQTSDDWLIEQVKIADIYQIEFNIPKKMRYKIALAAQSAFDGMYDKLIEKQYNSHLEA